MSLAIFLTGRWILTQNLRDPIAAEKRVSGSLQVENAQLTASITFDPRLSLPLLGPAENTQYNGSGRNIFRMEEKTLTEKTQTQSNRDKRSPPSHSASPQIRLQFFGYAEVMNLPRKIFLKDGDSLFIATEGAVVDSRYKIVGISLNSVDVDDLVDNTVHTISLN